MPNLRGAVRSSVRTRGDLFSGLHVHFHPKPPLDLEGTMSIDTVTKNQQEMYPHFARIAKVYRDVRTTDHEPVEFIRRALADRDAVQALEVGCGTGRYTHLLFQSLPKLEMTCNDVNREMLNQLETNLSRSGVSSFRTLLGRIETLDLERESLDAVFTFNAVHHFDFPAFLRIISRALREAGRIFIYTRTPGQNGESVWGKYFPKFIEKETRLFELSEMQEAIHESDALHLEATRMFSYPRCFSLDRLLAQVRNRHYSTFSLYSDQELEEAIELFRENLQRNFSDPKEIRWSDRNVMLQIGKS